MTVEVLADEVTINGPDGVGISITAEAAAESGRRLTEAAAQILKGRGDLANGTEDKPPE